MTKSLRGGKIFVDWSQNNPAKTTVAPYSLRARDEPTVSTPLTWDEVEARRHAAVHRRRGAGPRRGARRPVRRHARRRPMRARSRRAWLLASRVRATSDISSQERPLMSRADAGHTPNWPAADGCPARRGASSCSPPRRRCSSPTATTPPRWTTSPSAPGVSKPVLYQHFPGKLELYLALIDTQAETLSRAVHEALAATDDNRERIHGVLSAYFSFVDRDGSRRRVPADLRDRPGQRAGRARPGRGGVREDDEGGRRHRRRRHRPRPRQAELLATALTGAAQVAARWWLDRDRPITAGRRRSACSSRCCGEASRTSPA